MSAWSITSEWARPSIPTRVVAAVTGGAIALAPVTASAGPHTDEMTQTAVSHVRASQSRKEALRTPLALELPGSTKRRSLDESGEDDYPPASGAAPMVAGAVMTGFGIGFLVAFGVETARNPYALAYRSSNFYGGYSGPTLPLAVVGGALLGVGIPILVVGAAKQEKRARWFEKKKWDERRRGQDISFGTGPTRGGWYGRLRVRF